MSNQLQNICVFIEDEKQLQEARELLERFGQRIDEDTFQLDGWDCMQIYSDNTWGLNLSKSNQITLTELEKLLEDEKPNT